MSDSRTDLPERSVHIAAGLVGAVHDQDPAMVAHWLRMAENGDGMHALAVVLAAMVDDTKTTAQLLGWVDDTDRSAWRNSLTDEECRRYHRDYAKGDRDPATVDGHREWDKRRNRKRRRQQVRRALSAPGNESVDNGVDALLASDAA